MNIRKSRINPVKILQTQTWLNSLQLDYNCSKEMLETNVFNSGDESTRIVNKWKRGAHSAQAESVERVTKIYLGSDKVFKLPVFLLLDNSPISKKELKLLFNNDITPTPYFTSLYPSEPALNFSSSMTYKLDSQVLFKDDPISSFTFILYLIRKAECTCENILHVEYLKDAYKVLPLFCKHRYFKDWWEAIYYALYRIHKRVETSSLLLRPEKDIIYKHMQTDAYSTIREDWPRHPVTYRFTEPEEPYEEAHFASDDY